MGIQNFSRIHSQKREGLRQPDLFYPVRTLPQSWAKKVSPRKLFEGQRINSQTEINFFGFRENDYNSAVKTHFWAWSRFNRYANFDPLRTNDGAFESPHQGKFNFSHLTGSRNNYKNNYLLRANICMHCLGFSLIRTTSY